MRRRTAVLFDRHPLWLDALETLLMRIEIHVLAKTVEVAEALKVVREQKPDLFIGGVDFAHDAAAAMCIRDMHAAHPALASVVLGTCDDTEAIEAAFAAGASVYCTRDSDPEDLASAIRQTLRHSIYFAADWRGIAQDGATGKARYRAAEAEAGLTRREVEILRMVAEGHSNAELAKMLWVTEQTVKFHLSNIYRKLGVSNRTEASRWAQLHGLLTNAAPQVAAAVG